MGTSCFKNEWGSRSPLNKGPCDLLILPLVRLDCNFLRISLWQWGQPKIWLHLRQGKVTHLFCSMWQHVKCYSPFPANMPKHEELLLLPVLPRSLDLEREREISANLTTLLTSTLSHPCHLPFLKSKKCGRDEKDVSGDAFGQQKWMEAPGRGVSPC